MPWKVVERKIGRAGGMKQRTARQREWDQSYGDGNWAVGYVVDGAFVLQEDALESIYNRSYEVHFAAHPDDLDELIRIAKTLRNPHAEATTGVDLQVPAIMTYLDRHGLRLLGTEVVDIGSWKGNASHAISIRLSPLHIHVVGDPKMTLEQFWQEKKCLAVWEDRTDTPCAEEGSISNLPLIAELEQAKSILLAGAGGGFDIFSGLPLYFGLRSLGKKVHLANLSFSHLEAATGARLAPAVLKVTADSQWRGGYFPEYYLSHWFRQRGEEVPIFCFEKVGCIPLLEGYRAVVNHLDADAIVLIDGGTDSLMRGDEAGLGTPEEDIASIAAVDDLDVEKKFLVCLGFGVDSFHGVCHTHAFEAVAELTRQRAFLGAFSLLKEMPEVRQYAEAVEAVFAAMPDAPSIVSASILSALDGHYGDHHTTARTTGSVLWINPLMTLYWCFRLGPVARRILYLDEIKRTHSMWDLMQTIDAFRQRNGAIRSRTTIPDVSLTRRLAR